MKKYIVIALAAVWALCSCTNGESYYDVVGGRGLVYYGEGRDYMMCIADNLVTDALDELEMALEVNASGTPRSSHFDKNGNIREIGTTWTVRSYDSRLEGLTLTCTADCTWELAYNGDYSFLGETYPTQFTLTAVMEVLLDAQNPWHVSLKGTRTERKGYSCMFDIPTEIVYSNTIGDGVLGWNNVVGDLYMTVYKNGDTVDVCRLSFDGAPSEAKFVRGL